MQLRTVAVLLLLVVSMFALFPAPHASSQPIKWGAHDTFSWQPNSVGEMRATAADIDRRLGPGEHVFTVMSEYHSLAEHYPPYSPRIYHLVGPQTGQIEGLNQTDYHDRMRVRFINDLQSGEIQLIIMTVRTDYILTRWPDARQAFRVHFCRVQPTPSVYQKHEVRLYEYAPEKQPCINRTRFETGDVR